MTISDTLLSFSRHPGVIQRPNFAHFWGIFGRFMTLQRATCHWKPL